NLRGQTGSEGDGNHMTRRLALGTLLLGLVLAACGASAGSAKPSTDSVQSKPQPKAVATAQSGFDDVVQLAKKEGGVSVIGLDGRDNADILTKPFQDKYGIPVEYLGDPGPGTPPR